MSACDKKVSDVMGDKASSIVSENISSVKDDVSSIVSSDGEMQSSSFSSSTLISSNAIKVTGISLSMTQVSLIVGEKKMPIVAMTPKNAMNKDEVWTSSDSKIASVDKVGNILGISKGSCVVTVTSVSNPGVSAKVSVTVKASAVDASTNADWRLKLVNKQNAIDDSYYVPIGTIRGIKVDSRIIDDTEKLLQAAKKDGVSIGLMSGYRSISYQKDLLDRNVTERMNQGMSYKNALADALISVAPPGKSEHNLGLAIDFSSSTSADLNESFQNTPQGKWLKKHAREYGFILRYPKNKQSITQYTYEPWHFRYVGVESAKKIEASGLCFEEWLERK
jgi:D-alanyl-D-alanine carboxypeptidase